MKLADDSALVVSICHPGVVIQSGNTGSLLTFRAPETAHVDSAEVGGENGLGSVEDVRVCFVNTMVVG